MKRTYFILLAALLTAACAGNGDTVSPTPHEGEILFSGSTAGPEVRTSYEDTETALRVNWVRNDLIGLFAESGGRSLGANFAYKAVTSGAASDFTAASRLNVIRWADATSDHDFYAYYPHAETVAVDVTAVPVSVPAVQTRAIRWRPWPPMISSTPQHVGSKKATTPSVCSLNTFFQCSKFG